MLFPPFPTPRFPEILYFFIFFPFFLFPHLSPPDPPLHHHSPQHPQKMRQKPPTNGHSRMADQAINPSNRPTQSKPPAGLQQTQKHRKPKPVCGVFVFYKQCIIARQPELPRKLPQRELLPSQPVPRRATRGWKEKPSASRHQYR